ncbi:hypothetical protein EVAR_74311_1 [Eumeta japonica]|uniref:Uncharacterized protein n=1 Tax=Eumeta variegata TaxID=151549 RepID=A0A4C1SCP8_EUMVA|nr:hypothetical protein EVAR_74311_1 [Eumeta japonica]
MWKSIISAYPSEKEAPGKRYRSAVPSRERGARASGGAHKSRPIERAGIYIASDTPQVTAKTLIPVYRALSQIETLFSRMPARTDPPGSRVRIDLRA